MSSYFVLECYGPADAERAAIGDVIDEPSEISWISGKRFQVPLPSPLEVRLSPDDGELMMPMFERGVLLMSDAMLRVLFDCGVDNLDLYPALVVDTVRGVQYHDYKAVNIIGAVAAADLSNSVYTAHRTPALIDTDFERLAIDDSKAHELPLFRLAECVTAKVVHRRVKEALEKAIPYLDFVVPEEWFG